MRNPSLVSTVLALAASACPCAGAGPRDYLSKPDEWFQSAEGRRIVDNVVSWQSSAGSWPKNMDTTERRFSGRRGEISGTFDNGATVGELRLLARAYRAARHEPYRDAFRKGVVHILEAQYPTGGWPQFHPPSRFYHRHITFNDDTVVNLLELMRWVATSAEDDLVGARGRRAARRAFERGIDCILKCQIVVNGRKTVWCAQHDAETLEPRQGRSYELVSLSGGESVGVLLLLMSIDDPSPAVVDAIVAGAGWYESSEITDEADLRAIGVEKPGWARFYEIPTNRPIFSGRDGVKKFSIMEIERERREGYAWWGRWGDRVAREYSKWTRRHMDHPTVKALVEGEARFQAGKYAEAYQALIGLATAERRTECSRLAAGMLRQIAKIGADRLEEIKKQSRTDPQGAIEALEKMQTDFRGFRVAQEAARLLAKLKDAQGQEPAGNGSKEGSLRDAERLGTAV
ncbi:MAG: pectate lyase [Candidatus Brocadiia bacterium]